MFFLIFIHVLFSFLHPPPLSMLCLSLTPSSVSLSCLKSCMWVACPVHPSASLNIPGLSLLPGLLVSGSAEDVALEWESLPPPPLSHSFLWSSILNWNHQSHLRPLQCLFKTHILTPRLLIAGNWMHVNLNECFSHLKSVQCAERGGGHSRGSFTSTQQRDTFTCSAHVLGIDWWL